MISSSLEVDARNIDGSTPLCDACASGSIECVKVLLSHGAKVNPPLYTASPLHEACMNGKLAWSYLCTVFCSLENELRVQSKVVLRE